MCSLDLEADEEVSKIMQELTAGILTSDTVTPVQAPVVAGGQKAGAPIEEEDEEERDGGMTQEEMSGYQDRLRNI